MMMLLMGILGIGNYLFTLCHNLNDGHFVIILVRIIKKIMFFNYITFAIHIYKRNIHPKTHSFHRVDYISNTGNFFNNLYIGNNNCYIKTLTSNTIHSVIVFAIRFKSCPGAIVCRKPRERG